MYSVSSNFLSAVAGNERTVKLRATFNSNTELDGEHLFNYTLTEMINSEGITMGAVCSNKIEIKMAMPSTSIALANGWVDPEVGLEINGSVEYVPLGKFYITEIESKDDYKTVTITGYDGMCKLEEEYETTITTWPASISSVVNDIATQYGFEIATTTFPSYTIDYIEGTCREYLGWIAGLMGKNARFNRDGKLEFKWYEVVEVSTQGASVEYGTLVADEGSYSNGVLTLGTGFSVSSNTLVYSGSGTGTLSISRALQYQNGLERTKTDSFTVSSITSGTEDNVLVAGSGVGITFENPFMTQEIMNSIKTDIGTVTFNPCEVKWKGNPALEVGDIVTVKDKNNSDLTVYVMEQTINIGGGISGEIFCYGESETSISFSTEGPTSKKIKQVYTTLQNAIKEATELINGANGGIFKLTDSDNDGINDGWLLAEHDGDLTATTKCIVGNYEGIGLSTDGGATYRQAITHQGIVASAVIVDDLKAFGATIGGWTISTNNIYKTVTVDDVDYNAYIQASDKGGAYNAFCVRTKASSATDWDTQFYVTYGGKLFAKNADISGKITATSGTIGGFTLSSSRMYALSSNNTYTMVNGNNFAFVAGSSSSDTATDAPFKVYHTGKLVASNAIITGEITAESGSIAGYTIGSGGSYDNAIYKRVTGDSAKYEVGLKATSGETDLAFYVKKSTDSWSTSSNTFYVNNSGKLYCTDAVITGEINATSGTIANWTISANRITVKNDDGTYNSINNNTGSSYAFVAGAPALNDSASAPFRVTHAGKLYATNAVISGDSTISSACIPNLSAAKITSGTISTDRLDTSVITTGNFSAKTLTTGNLTVDNGCYVGSWYIGSGGLTSGNVHITTNALVYGSRQCTWADVTACVQAYSSDRRLKNSINAMDDKYSALFDSLNPVIYKFNSDGDSAKTRIGFIAQDVQGAIVKAGLEDLNCVYASEGAEEDYLRLSYTDFIALNTREIQKLKARVAELERKLTS